MRILIFNWKDVRHPLAGGAEYATHEFAKHLVLQKHQVTIFTSTDKSLPATEIIDGVKIIRTGSAFTVYVKAWHAYRKYFHKNCDVVIDQIHGLPFFTPLYVRQPIVAYIHEIAGPIWFKEFSLPLAFLGSLVEHWYFYFYKNTYFLTDSSSTKQELINYDINAKRVKIIPLTIKPVTKLGLNKTVYPQLVYIGRITSMKRIELLIEAAEQLVPLFPTLQVIICGVGKKDYSQTITNLINKKQLSNFIHLRNYVDSQTKYKLLRQSWLAIHPSIKEGFGLTVLEAASQATPTVCFTVAGLKNIVINNRNGIKVSSETSQALAHSISLLLNQPKQLVQLSASTYEWYKQQPDWSTQTLLLEKYLQRVIRAHQY